MSKFLLPAAAVFALTFLVATPDTADAQGFHFSNGRVHVDVGNPHGFYGGYGYGGQKFNRGHGYHSGHHRVHRVYPRHTWHDTSHWDWHPTEYRWHGNHWDVQPGHYDWHQEGHIDHHHD